MAGLFKAFEYEVASQSDEIMSDTDSVISEDGKERPPERVPLRYVFVPLCTIIALVVGVFTAGWVSCSWTTGSTMTNFEQILALRDGSAIDGLHYGAVAADHEACSKLGTSILVKGGNAVDAAVATTLCLGVANPASSGLGGGAFILIHSDRAHHEARYELSKSPKFEDKRDPNFPVDKDKMTEVIDCRETAPSAASQDMFLSKSREASAIGGLSVAVPGELRGLELAHARHGSLPWSEVIEPIIHMATNGVPVSAHLATDIKNMATLAKKTGENPALRSLLTKHDRWDSALREGDLLLNYKLADTLSLVAQHGSKAFYEGDLAERLAKEVQSEGGVLTAEDMMNYVPVLRSPVYGVASGYTIVGVPPPSSGGATIIGALRFLSGYKLPMAGTADTLSVHRTVEAMRHAFAIRMSLSDPAYYTNKTAQAVPDLTAGPYMENLRKSTLDNTTLRLSQYGGAKWAQLKDHEGDGDIADAHEGDRRLRKLSAERRKLARTFGYLNDFGTTHLSIVDKDGNSVAITSSVNQIFGSHIFSRSTGVVIGDTMDGKFRQTKHCPFSNIVFLTCNPPPPVINCRLWKPGKKQLLRANAFRRKLHRSREKGKWFAYTSTHDFVTLLTEEFVGIAAFVVHVSNNGISEDRRIK
jgi:gamma-glutamyltranspeptidase